MCKEKRMRKLVPASMPATMTEQTNRFKSTNKAYGKLTGVNLVFHQWTVV